MLFIIKIIFPILFVFSLVQAQGGLAVKADNAEVKEDESVKINVLKNDNIIDKTNLSIEIKTEPQKGVVVVKKDRIIYTPNPNVNGVDKFEYKVDIGTATVSPDDQKLQRI